MLNDYVCIILDIFCISVYFFNMYIKFILNNKIFIYKDCVFILFIEDIIKICVFFCELFLCGDFFVLLI